MLIYNSKNMFISIVTVVYNGEKTIRRTIESVLCQEFKDYEYIIVDGLSKDNTVNIAKEYEERFEGRLRIYSERDKGIYDAMNKGIKLAKGEYIWLVNADDWIAPDALNSIFSFHKERNLDFAQIIQGGINIRQSDDLLIKYSAIPKGDEHFAEKSRKLQMGIIHPAVVVPQKVYDEVGLYDDRYYISADVDFAIRCYRKGVKIVNIQSVLTNMSDGGISNMLPIRKNWHDWNLRYDKFCKNKFQKIHYLSVSLAKLLVRKYFPERIVKKLLGQ